MRVVVQRVSGATARLDGREIAHVDTGLVAFVGFGQGDGTAMVERMAAKLAHLRIFESDTSIFGRSVIDAEGGVLTISQFTLYGDCTRGRRPNFSPAAAPEIAEGMYRQFGESLRAEGVREVKQAPFGSRLAVHLENWGPFTMILDSDELWSA